MRSEVDIKLKMGKGMGVIGSIFVIRREGRS